MRNSETSTLEYQVIWLQNVIQTLSNLVAYTTNKNSDNYSLLQYLASLEGNLQGNSKAISEKNSSYNNVINNQDKKTKSIPSLINNETSVPLSGIKSMLELIICTPVNSNSLLAEVAHDTAISLLSVIDEIFCSPQVPSNNSDCLDDENISYLSQKDTKITDGKKPVEISQTSKLTLVKNSNHLLPKVTGIPTLVNDMSLLIIDDDQIVLDRLKLAMKKSGYTTDTANNRKTTLLALTNTRYDAIIINLQMSGADAYSLCAAIREQNRSDKLPIVGLTECADDTQLQNAYETGFSHIVFKPVNFINLAHTVLLNIQHARHLEQNWQYKQILATVETSAELNHWSWDINKQHLQFSSNLQSCFQKPLSNIITLNDFVAVANDREMNNAISNCLNCGEESSWEQIIEQQGNDKKRYIEHRLRVIRSENSDYILVGTAQDISLRRYTEQKVEQLALYDTLTKLNSRSSFKTKLQDLVITSKRRNTKFALLYLDLDDFKNINDSFGHNVGDNLLVEVANRLKLLLRESDFASRIGDDEFCLLINDIDDDLLAANIAQRCLELLATSVTLAGRVIIPHVSIGIAIYPCHGDNANQLLKAADTSMYEAKKCGKNQYAFYESAMTDAAQHRLTIENDLRLAIKENQFELYYQPQVLLSNGNVHSVEALIRWNHPVNGLCSPNSFIPDIERMGLVIELGNWVVSEACKQIKLWQKQGIYNIPIAVNISTKHFEEINFADDIHTIVNNFGVSPSLIEIEITESTSRNNKIFSLTCQKLRALGFRTAIDDFGTGYSSLSVLKDAAVDVLKIDRAFVRHLPNDPKSSILIGTILGMSKALGLQVVAEGIETEDQLSVLVAMGCHMAQGFYFSKPIPANKIPALTKCCFRKKTINEIPYKNKTTYN